MAGGSGTAIVHEKSSALGSLRLPRRRLVFVKIFFLPWYSSQTITIYKQSAVGGGRKSRDSPPRGRNRTSLWTMSMSGSIRQPPPETTVAIRERHEACFTLPCNVCATALLRPGALFTCAGPWSREGVRALRHQRRSAPACFRAHHRATRDDPAPRLRSSHKEAATPCPICLNRTPTFDGAAACGHSCSPCIAKYVHIQSITRRLSPSCPSCRHPIDEAIVLLDL